MAVLLTILLVLAIVLCGLAGFGVGHPRAHLGWLGVCSALIAYLLAGLHL